MFWCRLVTGAARASRFVPRDIRKPVFDLPTCTTERSTKPKQTAPGTSHLCCLTRAATRKQQHHVMCVAVLPVLLLVLLVLGACEIGLASETPFWRCAFAAGIPERLVLVLPCCSRWYSSWSCQCSSSGAGARHRRRRLSRRHQEEEETATSTAKAQARELNCSMVGHKRHGRLAAKTCQTKISCLTAPGESSASLRLHGSMGCMGTQQPRSFADKLCRCMQLTSEGKVFLSLSTTASLS